MDQVEGMEEVTEEEVVEVFILQEGVPQEEVVEAALQEEK